MWRRCPHQRKQKGTDIFPSVAASPESRRSRKRATGVRRRIPSHPGATHSQCGASPEGPSRNWRRPSITTPLHHNPGVKNIYPVQSFGGAWATGAYSSSVLSVAGVGLWVSRAETRRGTDVALVLCRLSLRLEVLALLFSLASALSPSCFVLALSSAPCCHFGSRPGTEHFF